MEVTLCSCFILRPVSFRQLYSVVALHPTIDSAHFALLLLIEHEEECKVYD